MGSLYGTDKINSLGNITFDITYPNKKTMDERFAEDGVFIGRYVLIEYGVRNSNEYNNNLQADKGKNWDSTVWQKTENGYKMISELNAPIPEFSMVVMEPYEDGSPKAPFIEAKDNLNYKFFAAPTLGYRIGDANFNKKGFNSEKPSKRSSYEVKLEKERIESGYLYGESQSPAVDIIKLNFNLEGLGSAMSDIWDIIYGTELNKDGTRKRYIQWGNTSGTRMITQDETGYTYNSNIKSVAGAINSVYDLMGQIIVKKSLEDTKAIDAEDNKIYYDTNKKNFFRKWKYYDFKPIDDSSSYYPVSHINEKTPVYEVGQYYTKDGNNYLFNKPYEEYEEKPAFYQIEAIREPVKKYQKNIFYRVLENRYDLETEENFSLNFSYCEISNPRLETSLAIYQPNTFVYQEPNDNYFYYIAQEFDYDSNIQYYYIGDLNQYQIEENKIGSNQVLADQIKTITFVNLEENEYYSMVENSTDSTHPLMYHRIISWIEPIPVFDAYQIDINPIVFLTSKDFYEQTINGYNLYINNFILNEVPLYSITATVVPHFFYPGTYYEKNAFGEYVISKDTKPMPDKTYYKLKSQFKYSDFYVIEDTSGRYPKGYKWHTNVKPPKSITLGAITEKYEYRALQGFAKSYNTIHGLILKLSRILPEEVNNYSRDTVTLQGCFNKIEDIIARFNEIEGNKLVFTDEYGSLIGKDLVINEEDMLGIDDTNGSEIHLYHKNAKNINTSYGSNNTVLSSGDSFAIPKITMGEKGHIYSIQNSTITIPEIQTGIKTPLTTTLLYDGTITSNIGLTYNDINKYIYLIATDGICWYFFPTTINLNKCRAISSFSKEVSSEPRYLRMIFEVSNQEISLILASVNSQHTDNFLMGTNISIYGVK